MEDLANSFTRAATAASQASPRASAAAAPAPAPVMAPPPAQATEPAPEAEAKPKAPTRASSTPAAGVVDPLQWWGALTQQFEQIASGALRDAASLKVPSMLQAAVEQGTEVVKKAVAKKASPKPAAKRARTPAKRSASRKR